MRAFSRRTTSALAFSTVEIAADLGLDELVDFRAALVFQLSGVYLGSGRGSLLGGSTPAAMARVRAA